MTNKFLDLIQREATPKKPSFLFYSQPGLGKTSLAANFPNVAFIIGDKEEGVNTLKQAKQIDSDVPVWPAFSKWDDMMTLLDELINNTHPYKYLAFDTLGEFERMLHEHVCQKEYKGDWGNKGFSNFQIGYKTAIPYFLEFLSKLDELRYKDVGIIFLAHAVVKTHRDPQREDYGRISMALHDRTTEEVKKWCDMIGYMEYKVFLNEDEGGKAKGGSSRHIVVNWDAAFEAKNRYGITKPINMGKSGKEAYQNLMTTFKEAMKGEK